MIEINLLPEKKAMKLPVILGMDLNHLNFKMIFIAIIFLNVPDWFLASYFEGERKSLDAEIIKERKRFKKLDNELKSHGGLKSQLEAFNRQVEKLKTRSVQVDKILKEKTNPKKILERLARDIPEDMWFDSMTISSNKEIVIKGGTLHYKSIGDFILRLNDLPFFGSSLTLAGASTQEDESTKKRIEKFEIKGKITAFDPWGK